jgi:hypothetical protein
MHQMEATMETLIYLWFISIPLSALFGWYRRHGAIKYFLGVIILGLTALIEIMCRKPRPNSPAWKKAAQREAAFQQEVRNTKKKTNRAAYASTPTVT